MVCGEDTESDGTCEKWVAKIHVGDFSYAVAPQVGRPGAVESHPWQTLTEDGPRYGTQETGNILKVSQSMSQSICSSLITLISLTFGFHGSLAGWWGSHLTEFPHVVLYGNGRETFHFQDKV